MQYTRSWEQYKKASAVWQDGSDQMSITVQYGFHYIFGNSEPYFSMTGDIYRRGRWDGGGACHDTIAKHKPKLAKLIPFHLYGADTMLPSAYVENGLYWMFQAADVSQWEKRSYDPDGMKVALKHFLWTEEDGDELPQLIAGYQGLESPEAKKIVRSYRKEVFKDFIIRRAPIVQRRYRDAMAEFGFEQFIPTLPIP